jgi:hypothetical protein
MIIPTLLKLDCETNGLAVYNLNSKFITYMCIQWFTKRKIVHRSTVSQEPTCIITLYIFYQMHPALVSLLKFIYDLYKS